MAGQSVAGGVMRSVGKGTGGFFGFIFKNFRLSFTVVIVAIIFANALHGAITEKDPMIFVSEFGGRFVMADGMVYEQVELMKSQGGYLSQYEEGAGAWDRLQTRWGDFGKLFILISNLWMIYIIIYIFYKLFSMNNTSEVGKYIVFSILFVILLNTIFIWGGMLMDEKSHTPGEAFKASIPFRGVANLAVNADLLLKPAVDTFGDYGLNQEVIVTNETKAVNETGSPPA